METHLLEIKYSNKKNYLSIKFELFNGQKQVRGIFSCKKTLLQLCVFWVKHELIH